MNTTNESLHWHVSKELAEKYDIPRKCNIDG